MSRVVVHPQMETFMRALAPEPRRRLGPSLKALPTGGITKALEDGFPVTAACGRAGIASFTPISEAGIRTLTACSPSGGRGLRAVRADPGGAGVGVTGWLFRFVVKSAVIVGDGVCPRSR